MCHYNLDKQNLRKSYFLAKIFEQFLVMVSGKTTFNFQQLSAFSLMQEEDLKLCQNSSFSNFRRYPFAEDLHVIFNIYM